MRRARLVWLAATLATAACVERVSAPGQCPAFCPSGSIQIVDTVLGSNVTRDSAHRGYVLAHQATAMVVSNVPGEVESRAVILTEPFGRLVLQGDTVTDSIVASDSVKLRFVITRRDTSAHDVTLAFHVLPRAIDSTTTYAALAGSFAGSPVRSVNLDSLLAKPNGIDSTTGDSIAIDATTHRLTVSVRFDSLQLPFVAADSGQVGIGMRVTADAPASVAVATRRSGVGFPTLTWYAQVDSITDTSRTRIHKTLSPRGVLLDTYVFDPPPAALDSTLAVGSAPSGRSLLRINLPRAIRDSSQVIRATMILVPAVAARGAPGDSFVVEAHTVLADFGAKSPIAVDEARTDTTMIRIGATDTARIEVTNLVQFWASDTLVPTALMLRAQDEGASPAEIRFYPSAAAAYAPALRLTFARKFPFGVP